MPRSQGAGKSSLGPVFRACPGALRRLACPRHASHFIRDRRVARTARPPASPARVRRARAFGCAARGAVRRRGNGWARRAHAQHATPETVGLGDGAADRHRGARGSGTRGDLARSGDEPAARPVHALQSRPALTLGLRSTRRSAGTRRTQRQPTLQLHGVRSVVLARQPYRATSPMVHGRARPDRRLARETATVGAGAYAPTGPLKMRA